MTYNEANRLETVAVNLAGATTPTAFVTNIDYDAKGRRAQVEFGNGVTTDVRLRSVDVPHDGHC